MEDRSIVVDGDVLVGNYVELSFGLIAKNVIAGEHVKVQGNILSENDVRIDLWSEITGDVRTKTDAYLGEFVRINGKLFAAGNLDVGNNVQITGGYDVKGWLVVRNPLPVVMFMFFYLMALLHVGKEEEVERALEELFAEEMNGNSLMMIPNRTKIDLQSIRTTSSAVIGNYSRMTGNIRARSLSMGKQVTLFGSVRTTGSITVGNGSIVHGNLVSKGKVRIGRNCKVLGKITADEVILHETSHVEGSLEAIQGTLIEEDDLTGLDDREKILFYGFMLLDHQ